MSVAIAYHDTLYNIILFPNVIKKPVSSLVAKWANCFLIYTNCLVQKYKIIFIKVHLISKNI